MNLFTPHDELNKKPDLGKLWKSFTGSLNTEEYLEREKFFNDNPGHVSINENYVDREINKQLKEKED